jgi:hypothetical protein
MTSNPVFNGAASATNKNRTLREAKTRDLVFTFWHETWADSVQRQFMTPDRLVQTLLSHERVGGLLMADAYRMGPTQFLRRVLGRRPIPVPSRPHPTAVVSPLRLRRRDGTGEPILRAAYTTYDKHVSARSRELGLRDPAVITTNPFYAAYAPLKWAGPVTYYAFDDWAAFDEHSKWWPDYDRAYEAIRRRGHRVCAVSRHLLQRLDPRGPGLVVPNGITPSEWQEPWNVPDWLMSLPRPRILYSGAIHGRLDVAAVREVATRFSSGSVIVIGPVADAEVVRQLKLIPGVHVQPPLEQRDLIAGLTRSVDVCIMPHHRTPLTESMSPLKIYEYVAAGRPVASTDIAPVRGIHKNVVLVADGDSFADGVAKALAVGPMTESDRQSFLTENSWPSRHEQILELAFAE